jgi:hypothetical protein
MVKAAINEFIGNGFPFQFGASCRHLLDHRGSTNALSCFADGPAWLPLVLPLLE